MRTLYLELEDKTFTMLEEITEHYNKETGIAVGLNETLEQLIYAHYITEIAPSKENKK
jgi:hypothetical protein